MKINRRIIKGSSRRLTVSILRRSRRAREKRKLMEPYAQEDSIELFFQNELIFMPDSGGVMTQHYKSGIFYEMGMLEAIRSLARPGTYIDVGANIGNHSLFFEMFCPSERVIAFEPLQVALGFLKKTRKFNQLQFEIHELGLSDHHGKLETAIGPKTYTIPVIPLDDFNLDDVSIVKMDIEGMEPEAIRGMSETLLRCRPILFIEAHTQDEINEQENILNPLGYQRSGRVWNATPTYEWIIS